MDAAGAIAMAGSIPFQGFRQGAVQTQVAGKIVGFLDPQLPAVRAADERDDSKFRLRQFAHSLHGVVHYVAEQRIDLYGCQKVQEASVCHAGKADTVPLAGHGFFAQNHIQHLVAGFDAGIVKLNGGAQRLCLFGGKLTSNFVQDVLQVVALHVDHIHIGLDGLELGLVLAPQLVQHVNLVVPLVEKENVRAGKQHLDAKQDAEDLDDNVQRQAFGLIGAGNTDQHVHHQNGRGGKQADAHRGAAAAVKAALGLEKPGEQPVTGQVKSKVNGPVPPLDVTLVEQRDGRQIIVAPQQLQQGIELVGQLVGRRAGTEGEQQLLNVVLPAKRQCQKVQQADKQVAQHPHRQCVQMGVQHHQREAQQDAACQRRRNPQHKMPAALQPLGKKSQADEALQIGQHQIVGLKGVIAQKEINCPAHCFPRSIYFAIASAKALRRG